MLTFGEPSLHLHLRDKDAEAGGVDGTGPVGPVFLGLIVALAPVLLIACAMLPIY
jgi:hypothetical protein